MMYSKESLNKLLLLIYEISEDPQHSWFKEELDRKFGSSPAAFEDFPSFLLHLKRNYRLKAKEFYKDVKDPKLKVQLVKDNVEMQWYQASHDIERFLLFAFYQVENLLNYYCTTSGAFDKIRNNPSHYEHSYSENFHVSCSKYFLGSTKIEKVNSIWAKLTFWLKDANRIKWYSKGRNSNIWDLINVRNKVSHRNSQAAPNENVENQLEILQREDFSRLGFYIAILKEIRESFNEIDKKPGSNNDISTKSKNKKVDNTLGDHPALQKALQKLKEKD